MTPSRRPVFRIVAAVLAVVGVTACASGAASGTPVTVTSTRWVTGATAAPSTAPSTTPPTTPSTTVPLSGASPSTGSSAATGSHATVPFPAPGTSRTGTPTPGTPTAGSTTAPTSRPSSPSRPSGTVTLALAGDVNFSERTADLLAAGPQTAMQQAADELNRADLTMVNLETAITTRGTPAPKQFHFRAPATALRALAAAGVDVATMANNHAADYGDQGLADTLAAIKESPIPVIGIGKDAAAAYAPFTTTVNGVRVVILAASQVQDWTLAAHTATATSPGIASAYSERLVTAVRAARKKADVVIVYLHWGIEYRTCPSGEQRALADTLAKAGATAVVGTHAHVLQGAGWRDDGVYVGYGLGNYYWWRSFGNEQDDNGVLTLTFTRDRVTGATFLPTHLDDRGVPLVATGKQKTRILQEWDRDRACADLAAAPPR